MPALVLYSMHPAVQAYARLLTFFMAVQGFIRDRMQAGYDAVYLRQIFDFIVYSISCMEAPARRESTQKVSALQGV